MVIIKIRFAYLEIKWIGNECGKGNAAGYGYLYWPELINITTNYNDIYVTLCVSSCPSEFDTAACYPT